MSGKVVGWAMEQRTGSPTTKLVLLKLADNSNEEGVCWPSVPLMVRHTELCERAIRKHLAVLEQRGLIAVERRNVDGAQLPNIYHLNVPKPIRAGGRHEVHDPAVHEDRDATAPDAGPAMHHVQSYKNPQSEPSLNPHPLRVRASSRAKQEITLNFAATGDKSPRVFRTDSYESEFEQIWAEWPHGAKLVAAQAWRKLSGFLPPIDLLLECLRAARADLSEINAKRRENDKRSPCHLSRWLDERRWEPHQAAVVKGHIQVTKQPSCNWRGHPAEIALSHELGRPVFDAWLAACHLDADENRAILTTDRAFAQNYILAHFHSRLERAFGVPVDVILKKRPQQQL